MLRADTEAEKRSKHEVPPNDEGNVTYEIKPCAVWNIEVLLIVDIYYLQT